MLRHISLRGLPLGLLLLSCASMIFVPPTVSAGAWVQPPGSSFWKASLLSQTASERWSCEGDKAVADPDGDFVQRQVFAYGEWGATERLTLIGSWAWKDARIDGTPEYGTRSTGDLRLGTRWGLVQGKRPLAVETVFSIPTYSRSDLALAPAQRSQFLPAGTGRVEAEIRFLAGASLFPLPLYTNIDLGYRVRGGSFGEQWVGALELGASSPRLFAKTELRFIIPQHEDCGTDAAVGAVASGERSLQVAPEVAVRFSRLAWVSVGASFPISGRNSLDAPVWSLGIIVWKQP